MRRYIKVILLLTMICFYASCYTQPDCRLFSKGGWKIVYNKFYKKYAVMRIDSVLIGSGNEKEFLVKNRYGEYGVYGEGWENLHCSDCGDASKSLFYNPCDAKKYLLEYIIRLNDDNWN